MASLQADLTHRTLSEGVEHILRLMILQGKLKPGERVNEVQIAEELAMSRGPVREALRRLQTEGLVVYHPHRGTYVATLSVKEAEELYTLRALLEAEAARLALQHMTSADVDALQAYIERFEAARQEGDLQGLITCDVEFHHIVVKASQHTKLFDMYKTLDTQLSAMFLTIKNRAPMRIAQVAEIHQELVDALRSRDEEVVMNAFREHYVKAWQAIAMVNPNEQ